MTFKSVDPNASPKRKRTLLEDAERLAHSIIKDARKGQRNAEGKLVPHDISDRAKALETALKFLQVKNKIDPEEPESEFERGLQSYHRQRGGDPDDETDAPGNGYAAAH